MSDRASDQACDRACDRAWTAAEIARALPDLGKKATVARRAAAEEWPFVERRARGGVQRAYPLATLPESIRERLAGASPGDEAPEAHIDLARERLELVVRVADRIEGGQSVREAVAAVATEDRTGPRTIRGWYYKVRCLDRVEWLEALLPRERAGRPPAECDDRVWAVFRDDYLRASKPALRACYRRARTIAQERGWPAPSLRVLKGRLEREVPLEVQVLRREGRDALQRLYPPQRRTRGHLRALQALNADGHKFDVLVEWPGQSSAVRPVLVAFQDLFSGKIVGWRLDLTENADLVRLAFADVVESYGVPEDLYLDNGRAFASKYLTGGMTHRYRGKIRAEDPEGAFTALGIAVHWTTPYHGQSKPIERAFGDLCESIAKHPLCEGAYTGRSPLHKPHNYGSRTVRLEDFVRLVTTQIREHNEREGRESEVCAGRSFDAVFAESYAQHPIRKASAAQRRLLLLAAERVRVRAGTGFVHLLGNRYWHPALTARQGQDVTIRFDPDHLKRPAHVYALDGTYLCAADCQSPVGFDDAGAAREHAKARRAYLKAAKKAADAEHEFSAAQLAEMHLGARADDPPPPAASVVSPIFGDRPAGPAKAEPPAAQEESAADELVSELGRAARSSGRIRPRRASND